MDVTQDFSFHLGSRKSQSCQRRLGPDHKGLFYQVRKHRSVLTLAHIWLLLLLFLLNFCTDSIWVNHVSLYSCAFISLIISLKYNAIYFPGKQGQEREWVGIYSLHLSPDRNILTCESTLLVQVGSILLHSWALVSHLEN